MIPLCRRSLVTGAAIPATLLLTSARFALTQSPPAPPPGVVLQMPDTADPSIKVPLFDVISVKPSMDNRTRVQFTVDGMRGTAVTARFLLLEGFGGISESQVVGEPSWSSDAGFDIEAKVADGDLPALAKMTREQRAAMFQQILADRFGLVVHHEMLELPIYQLTIAKNGSRLKQSAPDDPASATPARNFMAWGLSKVTATDEPLRMFVTVLSRRLGRPIVDSTGLTGNYDFTLEWTPVAAAPAVTGGSPEPAPPDASGPDIFTAIQEQMGLQLKSTKGPVDVIMIDHIEKPSPN